MPYKEKKVKKDKSCLPIWGSSQINHSESWTWLVFGKKYKGCGVRLVFLWILRVRGVALELNSISTTISEIILFQTSTSSSLIITFLAKEKNPPAVRDSDGWSQKKY